MGTKITKNPPGNGCPAGVLFTLTVMERTKHSKKKDPAPKPFPKYATYTDESIMPFGVHKGKALANVPADYLIFLYERDKVYGELKSYIQDNLDVLRKEVEDGKHA